MSTRVRQHVNPLSFYHLDTGARPVDLPSGRWTEIDLGCAEGDFLLERARRRPDGVYVGVEIRKVLVERLLAQAEAEKLPQVKAVYANLLTDLPTLFAENSADRVHILFPDPWFKRKHHKRRFLNLALAEQLARVLRPTGILFFQSDLFDISLDTLAVLESLDTLFMNRFGPWSFAPSNPYGVESRRERHCVQQSIRVWRLVFQRTEQPYSTQKQ